MRLITFKGIPLFPCRCLYQREFPPIWDYLYGTWWICRGCGQWQERL